MKTTIISVLWYIVRIWITSAFTAPLLFKIGAIIHDRYDFDKTISIRDEVANYFSFATYQTIGSFFTWIVFALIIMITTFLQLKQVVRTWIIFITGILLTIATFRIFFPIDMDTFFRILMLVNCTFIGAGIWFYKLKFDKKRS